MAFKVKISSRTWIKDNYNLFDYEQDKDLNVKELTIKNEGVFTRKLDETFFYNKGKKQGSQPDFSQITNEDKQLFTLKLQGSCKKDEIEYPSKSSIKNVGKEGYTKERAEQQNEDYDSAAQRQVSRNVQDNNFNFQNLMNQNHNEEEDNLILNQNQQYQQGQQILPDSHLMNGNFLNRNSNNLNNNNNNNNNNIHENSQVQDTTAVYRSQSAMVGQRRQIGDRPIQPQNNLNSQNSSLANYIEVDDSHEQNRNQINIQQLATQQNQSQPLLMPISIHQVSGNGEDDDDDDDDDDNDSNGYNDFDDRDQYNNQNFNSNTSNRIVAIEQRSGSFPIIIPHSNSAPSNFDYIVPFGYNR